MGAEIPVWVGGLQKWITGLTKKTTCEDIVRALLRAEGRPVAEEKDWCHYVIVERWRKVERPLESKSKILKVWKAWGEEQSNVKLTLKRLPPVTPKEVKATRKRPNSKFWRHDVSKTTTTIHPRKLLQQQQQQQQPHTKNVGRDIDGRITETMERLMKVIIAQGETIQAQLRRLQEKDDQIDCFEQQMHVMRMEEMGANYLLDTYLGDGQQYLQTKDSSAPAAPVAPPRTQTNSAPDDDLEVTIGDLRCCVHYYERFLEVSDRLQREEDTIAFLTSQINLRQEVPLDSPAHEDLLQQLERTRESVQCLADINASKDKQIQENDLALKDIVLATNDKQCYVQRLEEDLSATDEEGECLRVQHETLLKCNTTVTMSPAVAIRAKEHNNDTDSNSDTGLSSLHSSSDDGVYALDTLV